MKITTQPTKNNPVKNVVLVSEYRYHHTLKDPFKWRPFVMPTTLVKFEKKNQSPSSPCRPPYCYLSESRQRQPLEHYDLKQMRVVGTMKKLTWVGLIEAPDVGVVIVQTGDYLGRHNGQITAISKGAIRLKEAVLIEGVWTQRNITLNIRK